MKKTSLILSITLTAAILLASCNILQPQAFTPVPEPDTWPTHGWQSSTPEAQGMDSEKLAEMFEKIQAEQMNLHSLLIVRNGYLVSEVYFDPYTANEQHYVASVTKSVISALVGIAVGQGKLQGASQKVLDFFPDRQPANLDESKKSMTLGHLLSLSSGMELTDFTAKPQMEQSEDWVQFALDLPMASQPGTRFGYGNAPVHLLSAIVQKATGEDARSYANRELFAPLGIPGATTQKWAADPQGVTSGGTGLYLTPRSMAKLAFLYLHGGKWDGEQILPANWVAESFSEHILVGKDVNFGNQERKYGYLWSIFPEQKYFTAFGMSGQHLYIVPEKNMVVVTTAGLQPDEDSRIISLVNDYIIPSAASETALPANDRAQAHLEELTEYAAQPRQPVPALPETALAVSGKTFGMDENPYGWKMITLTFTPDADTAAIAVDALSAQIGLDNVYRFTYLKDTPPAVFRGRWETTDTFLIDAVNLGEIAQVHYRAQFSGDGLVIECVDSFSGSTFLKVSGQLVE